MKPEKNPDPTTLLEYVFTVQVIMLSRQIRPDRRDRGNDSTMDFTQEAISIAKNAHEHTMVRWYRALPN